MSKQKYFNVFLASLETSQFPKVYRGLQKGEADLLKGNAPGAVELLKLKSPESLVFWRLGSPSALPLTSVGRCCQRQSGLLT